MRTVLNIFGRTANFRLSQAISPNGLSRVWRQEIHPQQNFRMMTKLKLYRDGELVVMADYYIQAQESDLGLSDQLY